MSIPLEGLVSFNLHKFSYVTTASLNGPFPWSHLSPPELAVTFEEAAFAGEVERAPSRAIRVHRGAHCLEIIYVGTLIQQIREDNWSAGTQQLPDKARRALVLEHRPSIAFRYQLPDGQFRRSQLNFLSTSDFDQAVHLLQESGLPVIHKAINGREGSRGSEFGAMRPSTGSQIGSRPGSRGDPLHFRADSLSTYQPSQAGSHGQRPSSQTSQWMFQGHHERPKPIYGPSLVESTASYRLQPDPSTQRRNSASIYTQQMQYPVPYTNQSLSSYQYNTGDQHAFQTAGQDPARRSLFYDSREASEMSIRPVSASARNDPLGPMCPPRRDLPFSKPASRPTTSALNRHPDILEANPAARHPSIAASGLPPYHNPANISRLTRATGVTIPPRTETSLESTFWSKPPAPIAERATLPAIGNPNRPYTRSVAASVIMEDEPPKKKAKPSYSRPTTSRSGAAKSITSKATKASKAKQSSAVPQQAQNTKPASGSISHKKLAAVVDAEISTDSGRDTVELLSTRQTQKTTAAQPSTEKATAPNPSAVRSKIVSKPTVSKIAPEKKDISATQPKETTTAAPSATASAPEVKTTKPAAPKRKRTPAPKKPGVTYTSVGVQTTPQADRSSQCVDKGVCTDEIAASAGNIDPIPLAALDVSIEWQTLVEAFVLRHHDRVFARTQAGRTDGPPAPRQDVSAAALGEMSEPNIRREELERDVAACIMEPGFEALCQDVEKAVGALESR